MFKTFNQFLAEKTQWIKGEDWYADEKVFIDEVFFNFFIKEHKSKLYKLKGVAEFKVEPMMGAIQLTTPPFDKNDFRILMRSYDENGKTNLTIWSVLKGHGEFYNKEIPIEEFKFKYKRDSKNQLIYPTKKDYAILLKEIAPYLKEIIKLKESL